MSAYHIIGIRNLIQSQHILHIIFCEMEKKKKKGFTILYSKLCDKLDQKNVFYACTFPFLIFFGLFATIIYPSINVLHPHAFVDSLASILPLGFSAPLSIIRNWSFALFYVMAEMWGSVVASLLFWSFANEVTTVDEAKKYCEFDMI